MNKYQFVIIISVLISGCVNLQFDESSKDEYWIPFIKDATYTLTKRVFLLRIDSGKESRRLALVPETTHNRGTGFYSSPQSIEAYKEDPSAAKKIFTENSFFDVDIVGVVEKGTRLKPKTIKKNVGWDLWFGRDTYATRYFEILSGDFTGKIVDVEDLHWHPKKYLSVVTPKNNYDLK